MSELPHGWEPTTLDQIAEVRLGRQRSPKNHSGERMRPYLRAANLTWDGLNLADVKEMNFAESESAIYELVPGDVLVAEASGSASEVGKTAIWRGEIHGCCFQNTIIRVRSYGVSADYLRYFLFAEARSGRIGEASPGVGIHHIGARRLAGWPVPMPPMNEQRRIVAAIEERLSRLDAADLSLTAAARRSEGLERCVLDHYVFTADAPLEPVSDLAVLVTDGDHNPPKRVMSGVPHLTARNVKRGKLAVEGATFVSPEGFEQTRKRYEPLEGDVIVTCVGTIGQTAVVPPGLVFSADRNLAAIRPSDEVDSHFLRLALAAPRSQDLMASASSSTAQPHLYLRDLRALRVPLPPLDEQKRIVAKVEARLSALDALRASIDRAQRRSRAVRAAVLANAFRGELVPQDPSDEPASMLLERVRAERAAAPRPSRRRKVRT
jgi:type I restriction enzyme, S subunit